MTMNFLAQQAITERPFFDIRSFPPDIDMLGAWCIALFTLCVFSFLYKDNPFYKFAEHVFVGAGTAFFTLQYYESGVLGPVFDHIDEAMDSLNAGQTMSLGGFTGVDPALAIGLRVVAALLACMLLFRLVKSDSWAPRWPLAIMVGVYSALKMTGETQSKLVLPVKGMLKPITNPDAMAWSDNWTRIEETQVFYTFSSLVVIVGTICALSHFIFTYKRTPLLGGMSRVGVVVLMITFGSMFGFTVLGRIALLIERVDSLGMLSGHGYELFGNGAGALSVITSPPILMATLITLVLIMRKLTGKDAGDAVT
ncbi:MAG: hypothetical protein ACI9EF_003492 [Pseudohongiellaceae bacterium]|jgi:hypothetical protein